MKPKDMADSAKESIQLGIRMTMVLPRGASRKLPGFPRGKLMCENYGGRNVYSYDPHKVLKWLQANGLVND